jgi:chaperonin cofactor prefoldin
MVKTEKPSLDPKFRLDKERERLERTIRTLQERLAMIESELQKLD